MERQTEVDAPLQFVIKQFRQHEHLFKNVLDDLESVSLSRPNDHTNHVAWIAGHLVSTRNFVVNVLGGEAAEPHPELFANGKGLDIAATYPSLTESLKSFAEVSPYMYETLADATPGQLSAEAPFLTPTGNTIGDLVTFLAPCVCGLHRK